MHLAASDKDFSLLEIHLEGIQLEDRLLLGGAAAVAQCDPDSGKKFTGVKRLGDIIVGSGVQRAYLLLLHAPRGDYDDRHIGFLTNLVQHLHPIQVRKP